GVLNAGYNGSFTIAALPSISTATESGTTVTITTSTPHGLYVGESVTVSGVGVSGYNGTFIVTAVTDKTFTYTAGSSGLASSSGATAAGATPFQYIRSGAPDLDDSFSGFATVGTVHAVVGNGQQSATGQMSLSGDGQYLFITGYDNTPLPAGTAAAIPTGPGS